MAPFANSELDLDDSKLRIILVFRLHGDDRLQAVYRYRDRRNTGTWSLVREKGSGAIRASKMLDHREAGMHSMFRAMATTGSVVVLLAHTTLALAATTDKDLAERLVTGSPWGGTFGCGKGGAEAGSMTISFAVTDGKLAGEVTAFSGRGTVKPGPLDKVELNDGQLAFVTPSNGVYQDLRFEDGKLKGRWFGRSSGLLTFARSKP